MSGMSGEDSGNHVEVDDEHSALNENEEVHNKAIYIIEGKDDIGAIDLEKITSEEVKSCLFGDNNLAYQFYNAHGLITGFSVRKSKIGTNCNGLAVRYNFLCSSQGHRDSSCYQLDNRKRKPKVVTRFGCKAQLRVRLDEDTGRWYVTYFFDEHNHDLFGGKYAGQLRSHRKMADADVAQMNGMRDVGIKTPHIYSSFAKQSGGFQKVGFQKRDMYNEISRQRRSGNGNSSNAFVYLRELARNDPGMFWRHTADNDGRIEKLFWCDGSCRFDYEVFGEVLAFDATYRRNKFSCPLVVFSGVNHHNNTVVFASAIVTNESEATYVWVLEQFLVAMNGKAPISVITDGDLAMRNAIRMVFPKAHHRLCAWHLIRNATSNVGCSKFTKMFTSCMLSDYDVDVFRRKWEELVIECGVENNRWVHEIYEKKEMWAAAYMRGNFFAGFRTTSRCEGLHSQLGKYVSYRHDLAELLQHFQRALDAMRNAENDADFKSANGIPVLQTHLVDLERHAAKVFTLEIFDIFQKYLVKACWLKVVGYKETPSYSIYTVCKYKRPDICRYVSCDENLNNIKCSCNRMESFGIPCAHIVCVLFNLDVEELPECMVLHRWTKTAKQDFELSNRQGPWVGEALYRCRFHCLLECCRRMCKAACQNVDDYKQIRGKMVDETARLEAKNVVNDDICEPSSHGPQPDARDPAPVRTKGSGGGNSAVGRKRKRVTLCSICRLPGHTRKFCPLGGEVEKLKQKHIELGECSQSTRLMEDGDSTNLFGNYATVDSEMADDGSESDD